MPRHVVDELDAGSEIKHVWDDLAKLPATYLSPAGIETQNGGAPPSVQL